jgi:hypothetical protein
MGRVTEREPTPGIRGLSLGHCELRAYNAATGSKCGTQVHSGGGHELGVGVRETKKAFARLVGRHHPALGPWVCSGGILFGAGRRTAVFRLRSERYEASKRPVAS